MTAAHLASRRDLLKVLAVSSALAGVSAKARAPRGWDFIVVGAGVFGTWTAWNLRRAGHDVLLLDAWGAAHSRASSGGETRLGDRVLFRRQKAWFLPAALWDFGLDLATRLVVVVLPCVPATAMEYRKRISSPSISARATTGIRCANAASISGLPRAIALDTTTTGVRRATRWVAGDRTYIDQIRSCSELICPKDTKSVRRTFALRMAVIVRRRRAPLRV
jgi:hypothetical protein